MSQLRKPLTAGATDEYSNAVVASLNAGDDAAELEAALRAFDSAAAGDVVKQRLAQVINVVKGTKILSNGQVSVTMTFAGAGYASRDRIPVNGDGVGAEITVTKVGGSGDILEYDVAGGADYINTAAADSTGIGGEDATFTTVISNKTNILDTAAASIAGA